MKKVIYLFFVIIFTLFNFCGCVITEKEIKKKDCFNLLRHDIKIVVPKFVSQELEELAQDFENIKKNVKFKVVRIDDDALYRTHVLEEISNNEASLFFVHGGKDVNFFKDCIEEFNLDKNKNRVLRLNNLPVFKLDEYFAGIWFNPNILSSLKIDEKSLDSLQQFLQLIDSLKKSNFKNKKTNLIEIGKGIYRLISSYNFSEGEIFDDFENILKYLKDEEKDVNLTLLNGEKIFYIGDNRNFNNSLTKKGQKEIKCHALPIGGNKKILREEDYLCVSRKGTQYEKKIIKEFLEFYANKTKFKFSHNLDGYITSKELPLGFLSCLEKNLTMLKKKSLNFKEMKRRLKLDYSRHKSLDEVF